MAVLSCYFKVHGPSDTLASGEPKSAVARPSGYTLVTPCPSLESKSTPPAFLQSRSQLWGIENKQ